jgi:hypothetical protein
VTITSACGTSHADAHSTPPGTLRTSAHWRADGDVLLQRCRRADWGGAGRHAAGSDTAWLARRVYPGSSHMVCDVSGFEQLQRKCPNLIKGQRCRLHRIPIGCPAVKHEKNPKRVPSQPGTTSTGVLSVPMSLFVSLVVVMGQHDQVGVSVHPTGNHPSLHPVVLVNEDAVVVNGVLVALHQFVHAEVPTDAHCQFVAGAVRLPTVPRGGPHSVSLVVVHVFILHHFVTSASPSVGAEP